MGKSDFNVQIGNNLLTQNDRYSIFNSSKRMNNISGMLDTDIVIREEGVIRKYVGCNFSGIGCIYDLYNSIIKILKTKDDYKNYISEIYKLQISGTPKEMWVTLYFNSSEKSYVSFFFERFNDMYKVSYHGVFDSDSRRRLDIAFNNVVNNFIKSNPLPLCTVYLYLTNPKEGLSIERCFVGYE